MNELLDQLITMSRALGDPREDWVILGEGSTQMAVKTCRIIAGTLAGGGPRFLTSTQVNRIDKRPDELQRRDALVQRGR